MTAAAQLTSTNYQIGTYVVGGGVISVASSTNYSATAVPNYFVFDGTQDATQSGESSNGSRSHDAPEELDIAQPTVVIPSYIPDAPQYIPIAPPETATSEVPDSFLRTPYFDAQTAEIRFMTSVPGVGSFTVIAEGGTFSIPHDYEDNDPYTVQLSVTPERLPLEQAPDPRYGMVPANQYVYLVRAIDSTGRIITNFAKPITIIFTPVERVYQSGLLGSYVFDVVAAAWHRVSGAMVTADEVIFSADRPTLFGVWYADSLPAQVPATRQLQQFVPPHTTQVPVTAVCNCFVIDSIPQFVQCLISCYWGVLAWSLLLSVVVYRLLRQW